jgi:hypothetical protein
MEKNLWVVVSSDNDGYIGVIGVYSNREAAINARDSNNWPNVPEIINLDWYEVQSEYTPEEV